ncbi:Uncharacterised protein [Bordetella pertussis]|nr:Uncharacterised protein [Bordetella pertussis]
MAADSANDRVMMNRVLIPTRRAARRLFEVASTARPISVLVKNSHRTMNTATAPPIIHRLCDRMVAPSTCIGSSPENAGRLWICLPNRLCTAPRMKIEAPMVMMMSETTGAPRAGSIARRFNATPVAAVTAMASSAASGSARPAPCAKTVIMPPSMTNSPWAKFTTPVALKMIANPRATSA